MSTELATVPANDGQQLMSIIDRALSSPDFDVAKLQGVLDLKREWDRDRAAEAYAEAISRFQHRCPHVHKGRTADAGRMKYGYASLDDVMRVAQPHLTDCGIAVAFSTESKDGNIRVTVRLRVGIHHEEHTLEVPVPSSMPVNDTQKYGAALSYAKRYALCAALNIVCTDEDNDAGGLEVERISAEQEVEIAEYLEQHGIDRQATLEWRKVERISEIAAKDFDEVMRGLRNKAKSMQVGA